MALAASDYDELVEIWVESSTGRNALNEDIVVPSKVTDAWASISHRAAFERMGVSRLEAQTSEIFTIRYCAEHAAIAPKSHLIKWQGRTYVVRAVTKQRRNEGFDVLADARADDAAV